MTRALTGAATVVVLASGALGLWQHAWGAVLAALLGLFAVAVAWVVVRHAPSSPVGPALAWSTGSIMVVVATDTFSASYQTDHQAPYAQFIATHCVGLWPVNLAGAFALLLLFPDGPSAGRLWRALPYGFALAGAGVLIGLSGGREVDGQVMGEPASWQPTLAGVSMSVVGISVALAVCRLVVTFRRGSARVRQQVRWLVLAGCVVQTLLVGGWIAEALGVGVDVAFTPFLLAIVVLVPAAVGIAIVRHDLYDIDRLLSVTASWFLTLLLSAGLFGAVVLGASQVLNRVTAVGSTAAAFVTAFALLPLHRLTTSRVGRVVDRDRHVAVAAVERFTADVRSGRREPEEVEQVLRDAQGDPRLGLLLVAPDGGWVDVHGMPVADERAGFIVEAQGDPIARVVLGWESARARHRVADLAKAAWVPIEVTRLRLGLQAALAQTLASRARLAEAGAEERRRLERDLHDGAQQQLIAVGIRLRLVQRDLCDVQVAEVDTAISELRQVVEGLRRLAHGVRPARLDDGLHAALAAVRTATPLPFGLAVADLPVLDETRAVTAYLVVSEAVTNVLKHAQASHVEVSLNGDDDRVRIEIRDDGIGGVPRDAPLAALRDRVLSVGGTIRIDSPPGVGTTIEAVI